MSSDKSPITYGELKAFDASWLISHAIDIFCSNARFRNKEGWRDDAVRAPEMEILERWAFSCEPQDN